MSNDVKWIKITTDMFDDEKIRIIEKMPDGDTILVIWIKLLTLAGRVNAGGYILLTESIPYTDETLAIIFDRPLMTVQLALETFQKFQMLHFQNGSAVISNWDKHQNVEGLEKIKEQTRLRVAKHRGKLRLGNASGNVTVTSGNPAEQEPELELELEKETVISSNNQDNIFKEYESNIGMLTPMIAEELKDLEKTYPDDWIVDAIKVAVKANARTYRYIEGVLRHWSTEGRDAEISEPTQKKPDRDNDKYIRGKYGHMVQR